MYPYTQNSYGGYIQPQYMPQNYMPQNTYKMPTIQNNTQILSGKMVDSVEVAKVTDVSLDRNYKFFSVNRPEVQLSQNNYKWMELVEW